MRAFLAMIAAALLSACASPTYYPAQPSGEGSYYIARSPGASTVAFYEGAYGYSSFPVYGIYPWWSYAYYSPYFYPHHFSVWQPLWPYDAGSYWAWYVGYPYGFMYSGHGAQVRPRHHPVPGVPGAASPVLPAAPPAAAPGPGHAATPREIYEQQARWRDLRRQVGSASDGRRVQPMARPFEPPAAATSIPGSRGLSMPAPSASAGRAVRSREPLGRSRLQRDP